MVLLTPPHHHHHFHSIQQKHTQLVQSVSPFSPVNVPTWNDHIIFLFHFHLRMQCIHPIHLCALLQPERDRSKEIHMDHPESIWRFFNKKIQDHARHYHHESVSSSRSIYKNPFSFLKSVFKKMHHTIIITSTSTIYPSLSLSLAIQNYPGEEKFSERSQNVEQRRACKERNKTTAIYFLRLLLLLLLLS